MTTMQVLKKIQPPIMATLLIAAIFSALNCVGLNVSYRWNLLAMFVFMVIALLQLLPGYQRLHALIRNPVFLSYGALMLWSLTSLLWSVVPSESLLYWVIQVGGLVAISIGYHADASMWRWFKVLLIPLALIVAGYTLYQGLKLHIARPGGFMTNWNANAAFLVLLILPACGRFLEIDRLGKRLGLGVALLICAMALAMSQSRGATLVFMCGLVPLAWGVFSNRRGVRFIELLVYLVLGYGFIEAITDGGLAQRVAQIQLTDNSAQTLQTLGSGRYSLWLAGWHMYLDKPWTGWGLGIYHWLYPQYRDPLMQEIGRQSHNDYLDTLLGLGPIGLLLLLLFVGSVARLLWQMLGQKSLEQLGFVCAAMAILLHSLVDFDLYQPVFMLVLGLYVGYVGQVHANYQHLEVIKQVPNVPLYHTVVGGLSVFFGVLLLTLSMGYYKVSQSYLAQTPDQKIAYLTQAQRWLPYLAAVDDALLKVVLELLDQRRPESLREQEWQAMVDFALSKTENLLRKNPVDAGNYRNRADLLAFAAKTPEQIAQVGQNYQLALRYNPYDLKARQRLATLLEKEGMIDEARQLLFEGLDKAYFEEAQQGVALLTRIRTILDAIGASPQQKQALQAQISQFIQQHARFQYDNFVLRGI